MTTPHHDPTAQKLEGFEARLQSGFEWISAHPREVLTALGAALLAGLLVAGAWEWSQRREALGHEALGNVERQFIQAMGGDLRGDPIPTEPANSEQARNAREQALAGFTAVIAEHSGSRAAELAAVRAAEMEIDLGRTLDAVRQLEARLVELAPDDPLRAVALRLLAYAHETLDQTAQAGEAYLQAAAVEAYPDRALMYFQAGERLERAGDARRAADAYQSGLRLDAVLGEQRRVVSRIELLEGRLAADGSAAGATPSGSDK
jgi:tetratricopeptide (TPR) repeat protein